MLPEKKTKTNIGVGIGFLFQLAGLFMIYTMDVCAGIILMLIGIPWFVWGCMNYAEGKGHSKWVGLVGLAGLIGFVVLIVLPDKKSDGSVHRLQMRKILALISLLLGFALVVLGRWLDDLEYSSIFTGDEFFLKHPWPGVCMLLGACIVLVSLVLLLYNAPPNPREGGDPG